MSELNLGRLITTEQHRDAIHIAVAPVVAAETLQPGDHVGLNAEGKADGDAKHIGVIDPFLKSTVRAGSTVWLFLYPNTITSLRHEWIHPAFNGPQAPEMSESERWIRDFADRVSLHYNVVMNGAAEYVRSGEYLCFGGLLENEWVPDEFWPHYENVTGKKVEEKDRGSFFTCSC